MFERLFAFLFKFAPADYAHGHVLVQAGHALLLWVGLAVALAAAVVLIYASTALYTSGRTRRVSLTLRLTALALLLIPLFEPRLMFPGTPPKENFIAVMVDDSASMSIPDGYFGGSRHDDIRTILSDPGRGILPGLEEQYLVRYYGFSREAARVDSASNRAPDGAATDLAASLERVVADFRGLPLAGIVLLTDGGDNGAGDIRNVAEELRGLGIPLHTVGLGNEEFAGEREILDVTANRELFRGSGAEIAVRAKSWGVETDPVAFNLYKGETLVLSKEMTLKGNGGTDAFSLFYDPDEDEIAEYTLRIETAPEEVNTENNSLGLLIDSRQDSVRVLYLEGSLRTDFKFVKRAVEDDEVLKFTSTARTGTGKYYRQGIHSIEELPGGFPGSEEELFGYDAIVLGDIEANFFSLSQLELIEQFVSRRGGGFLMLGGTQSFAEGNYANTPIAGLLPLELDPSRKLVIPTDFRIAGMPPESRGYRFVPTRTGLEHPILKLSDDISENRSLWDSMPRLSSINYLGRVKPGATVLAEKPSDEFGAGEPLLAIQRYGKGRAAALATASTWRWQMLLDAEDTRHERFWRQFMRWLGTESPDKVVIDLPESRFEPGTELAVRVSVYDDRYFPRNLVEVSGLVTDPFGGVSEIRFLPDLSGEGVFAGSLLLRDPGVYALDITAEQDGAVIGKQRRSLLARPSKKEFQDAVLKRQYLETLTETAGGFYYAPANAGDIPRNLRERETPATVFDQEYVWDAPLLFLLAITVLSIEWIYRRRKGLP